MTFLKRFSLFLLGAICTALPWYLNFQLHLHLFFTVSLGSALALMLSVIGLFLCLAALRSQPQASAQYASDIRAPGGNSNVDIKKIAKRDDFKKLTHDTSNTANDDKKQAQDENALPQFSKARQHQNPNPQEHSQIGRGKPSSQQKSLVSKPSPEFSSVVTQDTPREPLPRERLSVCFDQKRKIAQSSINADQSLHPEQRPIFSGLPFASRFSQPPPFFRSPHNGVKPNIDSKALTAGTPNEQRWRKKFKHVEHWAHIFAYEKVIKDREYFEINDEKYFFFPLNALRGTGVYGNIGYATTRPRIYLNFQGTKPKWLDTVIADIRPGGPGFQAFESNRAIILNQIIGLISRYRYPEGEEKESQKIDLIISGHSLGASLSQLCFCALLQEIANEKHPTLHRIGRIEINIANDPGVNEDVRNEICRLSVAAKNKGISLEANIIVVDGDAIQQAYRTAVGYLEPHIANVELIKVKPNPSGFKWERTATMAVFLSLLPVGVLPAGILAYLGQRTYRKLRKGFYAHTKELLQDSEKETDIECFSNRIPSKRAEIIKKCAHQFWILPWLSRLSGPSLEWLHHWLYQQHGMIQDDRALRSIILKRKEGWTEVEIKSEFNKRQDLPALNWPPLSLRQALSSELKKENEDLLLLI